jgi:hypothetical protein
MPEVTLEELARRVEALEKKLSEPPKPGPLDWLQVVGVSEDNEFTRAMLAEIEARHEAERRAALEGTPE